MKYLVYIFTIGINIIAACYGKALPQQGPSLHIPVQNIPPKEVAVAVHAENEMPLVINTGELPKDLSSNKIENITNVANKTGSMNASNNSSTVTQTPGVVNQTQIAHEAGKLPRDIDVGALKRGSLVFLGLCVIVLGCYAWKTYRLRKGSSSPVMVQKYGVRANRSDIEMRPLPLDEEEDDDTLFEIGNSTNRQ